jgi:hypothetical protein
MPENSWTLPGMLFGNQRFASDSLMFDQRVAPRLPGIFATVVIEEPAGLRRP